jgi:hypothetical protein
MQKRDGKMYILNPSRRRSPYEGVIKAAAFDRGWRRKPEEALGCIKVCVVNL